MSAPMEIVFLGLSITSSWGNGHAVTYRGLVRELARRGHRVLFLERDLPWYADNRDLPKPPWGQTEIYRGLPELEDRFARAVEHADLVVLGSYVPEGIAVGEWLVSTARGTKAFYDIDTPVTVARLARDDCDYLSRALVPRFDLYLSFTGGPILRRIEAELGAKAARPLYCSADPEHYRPEPHPPLWDLGYLGTYSEDRQPTLDRLLLEPARRWREGRFVVAGPQYPRDVRWPPNVARMEHLAPPQHVSFYNAQRFALNVTRRDMVQAGWSPSVRLFEAGACGTPVVSDPWDGLETVFVPREEILIARTAEEALEIVRNLPEEERLAIGAAARARVLKEHTAAHRARQLEGLVA
ncbi:MAG TPA: glycosyltransferase [Anaeromyxobacteraceae bacterium]|nr:glycosyltransferase [Anaeromyxobacteraceae bacterium]